MSQTTCSDAPRDAWLKVMLAALLFCASACAVAAKLSTIKVGGREVTDVGQHIRIERDQKLLSATLAMTLQPGDTISTDADTTLVIRMADARAILMPNTRVSLGSILAWFGRVFISGWWQGKTKLVTAAVKGTQYMVEVDEKSELTTISVLEGTVQVSSVAHLFPDVVLTDAQRVRVTVDLREAPRIEPIPRIEYNGLIEATNHARDSVLDQLLLPDLKDVPIKDAEILLRQVGIVVSRREVVAPSPKALGRVTGQSPKPGTASRSVELQVGRSFRTGIDKVQIMAPAQVAAGAMFALSWSGPNLESDRVVLIPTREPDALSSLGLSLSARNGHGELRAPAEPGPYEIRFVSAEGGAVLARVPMLVAEAPIDQQENTLVTSDFNVDDEGWVVTGDAQPIHVTRKEDRARGGFIFATDNSVGGTFYFLAPKKYLGNHGSAYGKRLSFDLMTSSAESPFLAYGVMLSGGGITVIAPLPYDPTPAGQWVSYAIDLRPSGGWRVVSGPHIVPHKSLESARAASEADLRTVLGALRVLRIRGEFNDGPDEGALDNVRLGDDGVHRDPDKTRSGRFEWDTNRDLGDFRGLEVARPEECELACDQDSQCKAWTYVHPGLQGPSARCWLKFTVPPPTADTCCVSGVRRADAEQNKLQSREKTQRTQGLPFDLDLYTWKMDEGGWCPYRHVDVHAESRQNHTDARARLRQY